MPATLLWGWTVLTLAASGTTEPGEPRERLKAVGEELNQEALDVERLISEEGSLLSAIGAAERQEQESQNKASAAERQAAELGERLTAVRVREGVADRHAAEALRTLAPRLRAWQRLGPERRLGLFLNASADPESLRRSVRLQTWLRELLGEELTDARDALEALRAARVERKAGDALAAELSKTSAEAQLAQREAAQRGQHHQALLSAIQGERRLHERAQRELGKAQLRLTEVVARLPPDRMEVTGFALAKGELPRPVQGVVEVPFGPVHNPRFNTVTLQKGIDLRAPEGAEVRAVHRGRVVHVGWFEGYGKLAILDHGDGFFTLYAHLGEIRPALNDIVEAGDRLGTLGATGSLKGAYLYFEIRHGADALDPAVWLHP